MHGHRGPPHTTSSSPLSQFLPPRYWAPAGTAPAAPAQPRRRGTPPRNDEGVLPRALCAARLPAVCRAHQPCRPERYALACGLTGWVGVLVGQLQHLPAVFPSHTHVSFDSVPATRAITCLPCRRGHAGVHHPGGRQLPHDPGEHAQVRGGPLTAAVRAVHAAVAAEAAWFVGAHWDSSAAAMLACVRWVRLEHGKQLPANE